MFCSDDKHPDELVHGHINQLAARAVAYGCDIYDVLRACCLTPVEHYQLPVGLLRVGDPADFIAVDNLSGFAVQKTWIDGVLCAENGKACIESVPVSAMNNFGALPIEAESLRIEALSDTMQAIGILDGQIVTDCVKVSTTSQDGLAVSDPSQDVIKLVVQNRYEQAPPAIAFASGSGLQRGAIASTVAHDSHNIVALGVDDASLAKAINTLIESRGGLCACDHERTELLPLEVAGLMTTQDGFSTALAYEALDQMAKTLGTTLKSPYMTLSFLALLVIPSLKLSDKGLFNGNYFNFVDLFVNDQAYE
jgi:adenine deaminase